MPTFVTVHTFAHLEIPIACVASVSVAFFAKKNDFRSFGRARNPPPSPASFAFLLSSQFPRRQTAKNDTETLATQARFPWVVPPNTGIFFRGLKQNLASALGIPKENWG